MTNQPYDAKITETMQTVAELIALKPKSEWTPWVLFLLSELKTALPAQGYADMLAQLQDAIAGQLAQLAS
jgi:hypothetical protein